MWGTGEVPRAPPTSTRRASRYNTTPPSPTPRVLDHSHHQHAAAAAALSGINPACQT